MTIGFSEIVGIVALVIIVVWIIRGIFRIGDIITLLEQIRDGIKELSKDHEGDGEGDRSSL